MMKPMNFGELVESKVIKEADIIEGNTDEELIQLWENSAKENKRKGYDCFDYINDKIPNSFYRGAAALTLLRERNGKGYIQRLTSKVQ